MVLKSMPECSANLQRFRETTGPRLRDPKILAASVCRGEFTKPSAHYFMERCTAMDGFHYLRVTFHAHPHSLVALSEGLLDVHHFVRSGQTVKINGEEG